MPENAQEPEPVAIRRQANGWIPAPTRFYQYDGQAIVRTPTATHQSWSDARSDGATFPLRPSACERPDDAEPRHPALADGQFSIDYIDSDDDPVLYEVVDRGD